MWFWNRSSSEIPTLGFLRHMDLNAPFEFVISYPALAVEWWASLDLSPIQSWHRLDSNPGNCADLTDGQHDDDVKLSVRVNLDEFMNMKSTSNRHWFIDRTAFCYSAKKIYLGLDVCQYRGNRTQIRAQREMMIMWKLFAFTIGVYFSCQIDFFSLNR